MLFKKTQKNSHSTHVLFQSTILHIVEECNYTFIMMSSQFLPWKSISICDTNDAKT